MAWNYICASTKHLVEWNYRALGAGGVGDIPHHFIVKQFLFATSNVSKPMQYETSVGSLILQRTEREYSHYSFYCWNEYFWEYFPSQKFCHRPSVWQAVLERTEREDPLHSLRASCLILSKGIHPLYSVISHYHNKFHLYGKIILSRSFDRPDDEDNRYFHKHYEEKTFIANCFKKSYLLRISN